MDIGMGMGPGMGMGIGPGMARALRPGMAARFNVARGRGRGGMAAGRRLDGGDELPQAEGRPEPAAGGHDEDGGDGGGDGDDGASAGNGAVNEDVGDDVASEGEEDDDEEEDEDAADGDGDMDLGGMADAMRRAMPFQGGGGFGRRRKAEAKDVPLSYGL